MNIKMLVQDNESGSVFDISEIVADLQTEFSLDDTPGKLSFKVEKEVSKWFNLGSVISLVVDGINWFYGYVFTKDYSSNEFVGVVAYDQKRYLKNKDTYVFESITLAQRLERLCKDFNLQCKIVNDSGLKLAPYVADNVTLWEMLKHGIDETLRRSELLYTVQDNFGVLELLNVGTLKTDLIISDDSLLLDYDYSITIDENTYNKVKLVRDNEKTKKRDVWVKQDGANIARWGILQYHEKIDENATEQQIKDMADRILKLKNKKSKTLSLNCLGNLSVKAGRGIKLQIDNLIDEWVYVDKVVHNFGNDKHTMKVEVTLM